MLLRMNRKKNGRCHANPGNAHARNQNHATGTCPSGAATASGTMLG